MNKQLVIDEVNKFIEDAKMEIILLEEELSKLNSIDYNEEDDF